MLTTVATPLLFHTMTIEEYLAGKVGVAVELSALQTILADRHIDEGEDAEDVSQRLKDLCTADLYMWCATLPSVGSSTKDSDGGWSHQEGGSQLYAADKEGFRRLARDIYKKYGEVKSSRIKMNSFGMRVWGSRRK